MVHIKVLFVVLVQMHFIQRKQLSEKYVTSHAFQQISDLKILSECFRENAVAARGPVVGPHCLITQTPPISNWPGK